MAKNNYEAIKLSAEQAETDFRQTVMLAVGATVFEWVISYDPAGFNCLR